MQHLNIDERGPIYSSLLRPFTAGKPIHHRLSGLPPNGAGENGARVSGNVSALHNGCISMQSAGTSSAAGGFIINNPNVINLNSRNNLINNKSSTLN
ncbi:hypothetical protein [Serratia marcescens]|uniref:hypothetical protein n=1 Tax=Serratia marcescens TaxID=615 RepID=UPI0021BB87C6|nr:hypothetical protein [Serratia marcescens]